MLATNIGNESTTSDLSAQFQATQDEPTTAGLSPEITKAIGDAFAVIGVLWGLALPIFLIVWFSRGKIANETATWSDADDALPR